MTGGMAVNTAARRVLRSAAVSGAGFAGLQIAALIWVALAQAADPTTTRVAESVAGVLGNERLGFALALVGGLALAGAAIGAAHAVLRIWAAGSSATTRSGALADLAWTVVASGLWVLARLCATPALVAPSLPRFRWLDAIAFHAAPWMFYGILGALALVALVRGTVRRRGRLRPGRRWAIGLAAVAMLAVAIVAGIRGRHRGPSGGRTNVLVLAADSVRPDHMSGLGYARATTPNLDRLASQGALFDRVMAPLARTTPSWLSFLTGRYPHGHGIRHMFPDRRLRPRSLPTLPRTLAASGYRTAVISDYAGDFFPTFDLGFQREMLPPPLNLRTVFETQILERSPLALAFLSPLPEGLRPKAFRYLMTNADPERLADEAIAELDGDRPFFTVVFFSATHVPFASPYPDWRAFVSPGYRGEDLYRYDVAGLSGLARAEVPLSEADAQHTIALYDGALRSVDRAVGRILGELQRRGLDRSTLVVFLADHGENLFEPGQTTLHGKWFRGGDEANRVPLILRGPGIPAGLRVQQTVSLVDGAPTIADLLAVGAPPAEGRSLAPALRGATLPSVPVFAETGLWLSGSATPEGMRYPDLLQLLEVDDQRDDGQIVVATRFEDLVVEAKHRALWFDNWKLVYEPTPTGFRVQLYDLSRDPGQRHDVYAGSPVGATLLQMLQTWMGLDRERRLDSRGHLVRTGG
jgi:arylsulfatase A-like enzyme